MISHTRKIFHTSAANHDYGMFLKIVSDSRDVCRYFHTIRQSNSGDFSKRRVWFLWRSCAYFKTHAATKWTAGLSLTIFDRIKNKGHCGRFRFFHRTFSRFSHELIDCCHTVYKEYPRKRQPDACTAIFFFKVNKTKRPFSEHIYSKVCIKCCQIFARHPEFKSLKELYILELGSYIKRKTDLATLHDKAGLFFRFQRFCLTEYFWIRD